MSPDREELLHFCYIWEIGYLPSVSINENIFTIPLPCTSCHKLWFAEQMSSPPIASLGPKPTLKNSHLNLKTTPTSGKIYLEMAKMFFFFNVSLDIYSCIPSSGPYIKGARRDQVSWQIAVYFKINEFLCIHQFGSGKLRPSDLNSELLSTHQSSFWIPEASAPKNYRSSQTTNNTRDKKVFLTSQTQKWDGEKH